MIQKKLEKSKGKLSIKIKDQNLHKLYQQGSLKALMPDFHENLQQLMLINTAGGITSGDEYDYNLEVENSKLCVSTQAAEKIYSGFGNPANLKINLNLSNNSNLFWLPKELILFNNCNFKRKINFNLSKDSNLLICENIIFGRTSMKEVFENGYFLDFWNIKLDNKLIHTEAINTNLFKKKYLNSVSTLNNNSAVATIIIVGNKFLNNVNNLSQTLTNNAITTSNYSYWDNKLIIRLLSKDSYNLKFAIDKILSYFFGDSKIPKIWNI
jgi:urease accessory protein